MKIIFEKHSYKSAKETLKLKSAVNLAMEDMVNYGLEKKQSDSRVVVIFALKQEADMPATYVGCIVFKQYWEHNICELIAIFSNEKGFGTILITEMLRLKGNTYDVYVPSISTANGFYEKLGMTYLHETPEYTNNDDYVDWYFWDYQSAKQFLLKQEDRGLNIERVPG